MQCERNVHAIGQIAKLSEWRVCRLKLSSGLRQFSTPQQQLAFPRHRPFPFENQRNRRAIGQCRVGCGQPLDGVA